MPTRIHPSDSYVRFLTPSKHQPASEHINKLLPKYRITHLLGSGGFADVYEGTDPDGQGVAIKVPQFKMEKTLDSSTLKKFASEADIWKKLDHDNIVKIFDSSPKPLPHIVMELMEGGDLDGFLKTYKLTVEEAVHIMIQILEGVSYAHRMATIHRDLKPENILFTSEGIAKITDWGIGKYMASEGLTKTIETKGTLAYSAPEQFDSKKYGKIDWQTDIFQLGILFYEMLTGVRPFDGRDMAEVMGKVLKSEPEPPSVVNPDVPSELDEIIMGALEKEKEDRWDSGAVMLHELKMVVEGGVRLKKRKRVKRRVTEEKDSRLEILEQLHEYYDILREASVDVSLFEPEMREIEKYATLRWYDKVRNQGNVLLEKLEERYNLLLDERLGPLNALMELVRNKFEICFSQGINIEYLYEKNERAMEAYENEDYNTANELFLEIKEEVERPMDEANWLITAWKHFERLKKNPFSVRPPPELQQLIDKDVHKAKEKFLQWIDAIEKARIYKEKKIREKKEAERKADEDYWSEEWSRLPLQKQSIWNNSGRITNVQTEIYRRKLFKTKREVVRTSVEERTNFLGMKFLKIPGKNYYMSKYTITQKEWKVEMGTTPWRRKDNVKEGDDYPATYISWNNCQEFINNLNAKEGLKKYRFPTEEEWEHACRAGSTTEYCFGDDIGRLGDYAWYRKNTDDLGEEYAHRVGQKKSNKWGFYDMHGNICEWTSTVQGSYRVLRGGSWKDYADHCRSADRYYNSPDYGDDYIGIRLVRIEK